MKIVVTAKGLLTNPAQIGNDDYKEYYFTSEKHEFTASNNNEGQLIIAELIPRSELSYKNSDGKDVKGIRVETKAVFNTGQWVSWIQTE